MEHKRVSRRRVVRRSVNRALAALAVAIVVPLVVATELLRRGSGGRAARRAILSLAPLLGLRFDVRGRERLQPGCGYVFTPNHSSVLDIPALLVAHPDIGFAAAAELFRNPVLAAGMRALRTIPIERARPGAARRALSEAADRLGRTACLVIFPEGGIAPRGTLLPFKSGAFVFAIEAGVPIVPIAIHNAGALAPKGTRLGVLPGRVVVEFLTPIESEGYTVDTRDGLRDRARAAVEAALRPEDGGSAPRDDLPFPYPAPRRRP